MSLVLQHNSDSLKKLIEFDEFFPFKVKNVFICFRKMADFNSCFSKAQTTRGREKKRREFL